MNSEHISRLTKLQSLIKETKLDAFLITSTDSIFYLTGFKYEPFERAFFIVVRAEGPIQIVTPRIEAENMGTIKLSHKIVEYDDYPANPGATYMDALGEVISMDDAVGVEPTMPAELVFALEKYSPSPKSLVERLRLVKSEYEIQKIQNAATFSDLGLKMIMGVSKMGASIEDGYNCIPKLKNEVIDKEGHFDQYISNVWLGVWSAPYSAQPHRFPETEDTIQNGPNVGLSFLRINGYSAETERTFFAHEPSPEQAEIFNTMVEAGEIACRLLKPGISAHDVDHAVMNFLRSEGFTNNLLHRTGHGIGLGGHEGPWVAEGSDDVLEENMVISVEPGIYWRGKGGYRHSDTILITADGYQKLTDLPSDLISMTLST